MSLKRAAKIVFLRVFLWTWLGTFFVSSFSYFFAAYGTRFIFSNNGLWSQLGLQLWWNSGTGFFLFFGTLVLSLWVAIQVSLPLGRVVRKARRLSSKRWAQKIDDDDFLYEEEFGEFYDLERALDRMGRKLKRNKENLVQITNETSALMSSIDEGIVSINLERKVFFFNSQFAGQFISSHQSFESKIILAEVFRQPEVVELFENVLKSGLPDKKVVKLSTLMNESERYFNISVTPLKREKDQNIYGATGVFSDVTELKKTSLIRMDFVTNASHELRTPLTSVYGYLETLKEDFESKRYEEVSKFLGIVTKNVQRLQSLVNDLLTLAQIESQIEQQPEIINPCELTQHILSQMSSLAQKKNQSIHFNCQVQTLFGFSRQIEQVIGNLLSNAIKYSGEGKKIELIWQQSETEVQFIVKDQGLGISEEHIPRLFERFYRVDPSRSREIGGTGLGLSIVKHVMMNHQGHVKVQSSVGEGSQFICTFPVVTF